MYKKSRKVGCARGFYAVAPKKGKVMLDYTKLALNQIWSELKRLAYTVDVCSKVFPIAYLTYALIAGTGLWIANAVLLALAVAYFVFFLSMTEYGKTPDGKKVKKKVDKFYKLSRRLIKLFTLGVAVYGLFLTSNDVNPLSLALTVAIIVGWTLGIVFDFLIKIIGAKIGFVVSALEADIDAALKPIKSAGNFFKKITGQEVAPEKEPSENRRILDEKLGEQRREKRERKQLEREENERKKREQKEKNKNQKLSAKTEKMLLKMAKRKLSGNSSKDEALNENTNE